jgi:hypothetical protein
VSERPHREWEEDLAAHMLGALGDEESERFELHLATCERCRTDLRWLQPALDTIPASVEQVQPPRRLRRRLLDAARREHDGRRGALAGLRPAFALGACAVAITAGVAGYALNGSGGSESTTIAAETTPGARAASAVVVRDGDSATLVASNLRTLRDGRVYEMWLQRGGRIVPAGVFVPDRHGNGAAAIPHGVDGAAQLMVTIEAAGGTASPTSPAILSASLD